MLTYFLAWFAPEKKDISQKRPKPKLQNRDLQTPEKTILRDTPKVRNHPSKQPHHPKRQGQHIPQTPLEWEMDAALGLPQYAGFLKCSTPKLSSKLFVTLNRCGETNGGKDWKGVSSNTVEYMAALRNDHGEFHISISEFMGGTPSWDGSPLISDGSSPVSKKHSGKTKDSSKSQENT